MWNKELGEGTELLNHEWKIFSLVNKILQYTVARCPALPITQISTVFVNLLSAKSETNAPVMPAGLQ
jgi:hypothetical protein